MLKLLLELLQNLKLEQNFEPLPLLLEPQLNFEVPLNFGLLLELDLELLRIVDKLHHLELLLILKAFLNFEELLHFELLIVIFAQLTLELVDVLKVTHIFCGKVGDRQARATRPTRACSLSTRASV